MDESASTNRHLDSPVPSRTYLDTFLPAYEFRGIRSTTIYARPEAIFKAFREVTLDEMPWANILGQIRYLPERLTGRSTDPVQAPRPFLDIVLEFGNVILVDSSVELLVGVAGKLHQIVDQQPAPLHDARDFLTFDDPGYQKLAQGLRVDAAFPDGAYLVTFEHRTHALSAESRRLFARYWVVIRPTSYLMLGMLLKAVKHRAEYPTTRVA